MHVTFVALNGDETDHEFEKDATVGQAREKVAASQNTPKKWVVLMQGESRLCDDTKLLRDVVEGSAINLSICINRPRWSWAEKVDGTVHILEEYKQDPSLRGLLEHFCDGNGGERHGKISVWGELPGTPIEMLAFLRGEPLSKEEEQFELHEGVECWARDGGEGADWRPAKILCCAHCGDIVNHYTVQWIDGKGRQCGGDGYDGSEVRMLQDTNRGYTTAMTRDLLNSRLSKGGCHEESFSKQFGFANADDAWNNLPVAPADVQCIYRAQLAARPPSAQTHAPVIPEGDGDDDRENAPWWDVLELREVGPEHVAIAAQQKACYVSVPKDHAQRADMALRSLVGALPEDSDETVQDKASRCKFYTHCRTVDDGEGTFYWVTGLGWDPLVITANPEDATISFACANGTD